MDNNENIKSKRAYIDDEDFILEDRNENTHSLTAEELKIVLEARKKALLEQMAALSSGNSPIETLEDEPLRHGK